MYFRVAVRFRTRQDGATVGELKPEDHDAGPEIVDANPSMGPRAVPDPILLRSRAGATIGRVTILGMSGYGTCRTSRTTLIANYSRECECKNVQSFSTK